MATQNDFPSKMKETVQGSAVGLCVKDAQGLVTYQNEPCLQNCGNQMGQKCALECVANANLENKRVSGQEGLNYHSGTSINKNAVDAVMVKETDGQQTTLFYPRKDSVEAQFEELSKYGLSKRESEILGLVLQRSTRKQIAEKLCISLSTLKTHLNNIYKKLPPEWSRRLQERRV